MNSIQQQNTPSVNGENLPWYRQFWPWFIIALPASVVIASFFTLWLAITHPDQLVIDEDQYRNLNSELKAQAPSQKDKENQIDKSERRPD